MTTGAMIAVATPIPGAPGGVLCGATAVARFDAIVIGAGLAGSTTALLLARAGWRVALVEKRRFPRRKVCGECIAASNLPILHALGVGEAFEAAAGPELRRVTYLHRDEATEAALPSSRDSRYPWGRALRRETLDGLLLEAARSAGVDVFQPFSVRSIEGIPGHWRCLLRALRDDTDPARATAGGRVAGEVELQACELVDAHGSWEPLAASGCVTAPGRPSAGSSVASAGVFTEVSHRVPGARKARSSSDLLAFKANFRGASFATGHIGVIGLEGGYGGIVEADRGVVTVACCMRRDRLDWLRAGSADARAGAVVEAWIRESCVGVDRTLDGAVRDGAWLAAGPIRPGIRLSGDDAICRVGNAAGEAHPILGEGMSMALQGGVLLAASLIAAGDRAGRSSAGARVEQTVSAERRQHYAREWRRAFAPRLRLAAVLAHASMRPASAATTLRIARAWPGLFTCGARWGGKTRTLMLPEPALCRTRSPERWPMSSGQG